MLFLIALQFLTIIPIRKELPINENSLANSMAFFPIVGLIIGGITGLVFFILKNTPSLILAIFLLIIPILITGALHIDGFVDTIDGFKGGKNKEEILKIMSESQIGGIGACALILLILCKFIFLKEILNNLSFYQIISVLLLTPSISRWSMVLGASISKYAKREGLGVAFSKVRKRILLYSSILPILGTIFGLKTIGLIIVLGVIFFTWLISYYSDLKIGGLTGDILGGINEVNELFVLGFMSFAK
jgi:adenosylcobinamide-GDP ribazoletransferase